eukprot:COSAG01_NODE_56_length_31088_cov_39.354771_27_plen_187_part_00
MDADFISDALGLNTNRLQVDTITRGMGELKLIATLEDKLNDHVEDLKARIRRVTTPSKSSDGPPPSTTAPRKSAKEKVPAKPAAAATVAPVDDQDDQVCGFMLLADADYVSLGERIQKLAAIRQSTSEPSPTNTSLSDTTHQNARVTVAARPQQLLGHDADFAAEAAVVRAKQRIGSALAQEALGP